MTVGEVRKKLAEFDDQEVYLTEWLPILNVNEVCLQKEGVVIGD